MSKVTMAFWQANSLGKGSELDQGMTNHAYGGHHQDGSFYTYYGYSRYKGASPHDAFYASVGALLSTGNSDWLSYVGRQYGNVNGRCYISDLRYGWAGQNNAFIRAGKELLGQRTLNPGVYKRNGKPEPEPAFNTVVPLV